MFVGTQFHGTLPANATQKWFTFNWPSQWYVDWSVVPTTPRPGAPEIESSVEVERASPTGVTYWITIHNLTGAPVDIEARYAVLN